jgi:hypothetical protein
VRVLGLDEGNLLAASPSFELLFPPDRFVHIVVGFPIEQAIQAVLLGETIEWTKLVLKDPAMKISRETDV